VFAGHMMKVFLLQVLQMEL